MTRNTKQETLTALIETYGDAVTRAQLLEFEKAGRGNCSFIGKLYRSGRGQYQLPAVYDPAVEALIPSSGGTPKSASRSTSADITIDAPTASANTVVDEDASLSFAVNESTSAEDILSRIEDLVSQSSALAQVPERNSAFVPFGEFSIIRKIIKSKQFHPVFITGLS